MRVEVDGRPATVEQLAHRALVNYGHYTAMQVRDGRVRGLDLHLARLDAASRELFGTGLDGDLVRDRVRHALTGTPDASVRVDVFQPSDRLCVMVTVREPVAPPTDAQRLMSVPYQRPMAHLKHAGSFGQIHYGRLAERAGFDDALLTGPDGVVSEGSITNLGCFDGQTLVWPASPALPGITMQLVASRLPSRHQVVRVADLPSYRAVFVTNSQGVAPVSMVDDRELPRDQDFMKRLGETYQSVPWDVI